MNNQDNRFFENVRKDFWEIRKAGSIRMYTSGMTENQNKMLI